MYFVREIKPQVEFYIVDDWWDGPRPNELYVGEKFGEIEVDGIALGVLIIIAAYNAFRAMAYPKKTLSYLVEESVFQYKPTYAKKEVFMNNLCSYGFNSLFVRINDKVFCLDAKVKEPGKEGLENVSECRVNFSEPMNVEQFLNYNIDGLRICDIESFELLSINFDDPMNFITK